MKEWTREERYKQISDYSDNYLDELAKRVAQSPFRQNYHIQPNTGLLNDPNGFTYFDGKWHLFYQWFPMGAVHGLKHWFHLTSTDLVQWNEEGVALFPDTPYDSHGVYSGSGFVKDGQLHIMYTGNVRTEEWERVPNQIVARLEADGSFTKFLPPAIAGNPDGYTDHVRDPKVWEQHGIYYAVIGAQRTDETGTILMYRSKDALEWELMGEVDTGLPEFGFMWECPDLFEIDGKTVLLFSPQGLEPEGDRYHNIFQTGYVIADDFRMDELKLEHEGFQELDAGFDFYATQTAESPDGRRILTAWMGLPDVAYPTDSEDWAHCLTLPRELSIKDGKLIQQPVRELVALRKKQALSESGLLSEAKRFERNGANCYELQLDVTFLASADHAPVTLDLCEDTANDKRFRITLDPSTKKITIDRSRCGIPFAEDFGTTRTLTVEQMNAVKLQIFVDTSSIEIFVNDGEGTFTSRVFPEAGETCLSLAAGSTIDYRLDLWELA